MFHVYSSHYIEEATGLCHQTGGLIDLKRASKAFHLSSSLNQERNWAGYKNTRLEVKRMDPSPIWTTSYLYGLSQTTQFQLPCTC